MEETDMNETPRSGRAGEARSNERLTPLAIDPGEFRRLAHVLADMIAEHYETLAEHPVTPGESPSEVRKALGLDAGLPEDGCEPGPLLERVTRDLFRHSLFNGHPRFFGYITAGATPIGMLGEFLASAVNPNLGSFILSPAGTEIEVQTVRWIGELIDFPSDGGLLVSGGNVANLVGLLAARSAKAGWDVRAEGVAAGPSLTVYASEQTHTWVQKATDIAGLGTDAIRWIETDGAQRMNVSALRRRIEADLAAGDRPFMVVGTAGSVSTGSVDPLADLAAVCRELDLWFHVDGAYGAFAVASPDAPADLRALSMADSIAVDPHKWLYAPLEAGCLLVRDARTLKATFSYHPSYYHFGEEAVNFLDLGPQNSRGFRALKVWLALQQAGRRGYAEMITDDMALSRSLTRSCKAHPEIESFTQSLSISTFRFVPTDLRSRVAEPSVDRYLSELNQMVLSDLERGGQAFVSNAVIEGRYVLRACIVNFRTRPLDIEALLDIIVRTGRHADARARATRTV
jgi:aromatic-L-amino-acid decarboxylase